MKVVGLVVEYNPFHNGHLYHLQEAKDVSGADYVVCFMSGNFLQRGEPALVNKWARSEMALKAGADLVFELPVAFATQSAEGFAQGAIGSLNALGIVTHLCFGSELGTLDSLQSLAEVCVEEDPKLMSLHQKHLKTGLSYPMARIKALREYLSETNDHKLSQLLDDHLTKPNNILGLQYLIALKRINSPITPLTIQRIKAEYHDNTFTDEAIASATAIRESLGKGKPLSLIEKYVPSTTIDILQQEYQDGRGPIYPKDLYPFIQMKLRTTPLKDLSKEQPKLEGLENRLKEKIMIETDWHNYMNSIKTKRYPYTRLQRLLFHIALGYSQEIWQTFKKHGPQYLRLLGYSPQGKTLLKDIKHKGTLPLVNGVGSFLKKADSLTKEMLSLDITATNLYTLMYPNQKERIGNLDFSIPPKHLPPSLPDDKFC